MKITIQDRREDALIAGFVGLAGRIDVGFKEFRKRLEDWNVKAFCDGDRAIGMLMTKGDELHVSVLPEARGKWLSRRLIRETFAPFEGKAKTKVAPDNKVGRDFVQRIRDGFASLEFDPVTAVIGGATLLSGVMGASASESAANTQAAAADSASQLQQQQYQQTRSDLMPWQQAGQVGLNQLTGMLPQFTQPFGMQQFQESPAYQFNLEQGKKAIDKAAASRGMYYAPSTLQDIAKFSQGMASNEFQNSFNNYNTNLNNIWSRLYGLSGTGQNAAAQTGGFGQNMATNVGQNIMGAGNAQAAGTVGAANAISSALGQGTNAYLMNQILQQNQAPIGYTGGYGFSGPTP